MSLRNVVVLAIVGIAAALLFAFTRPVSAQECTDYNSTVDRMMGRGAHVEIIANDNLELEAAKAKALTGIEYVGVTRAFELSGPGGAAIGLEIAGCLLEPIWLRHGPPPPAT